MQETNNHKKGISVLMPTFKQGYFIIRAIRSLELQTFCDWELIIINDGSPDNTEEVLSSFIDSKKIRYYKNDVNKGLGFCLNQGIKLAKYELIAYLPSDDIYHKNHLESLFQIITNNEAAIGVYSNVNSDYYDGLEAQFPDTPVEKHLQLVQVLHHKTDDLWVERDELVTDSLDKMFFDKLKQRGDFLYNENKTCDWINHDAQRSRIINEKFGGGVYKYKINYNVSTPLRYKSTFGTYIDEYQQFEQFHEKHEIKDDALKILIVGELAYNPERIYALEEKGHKLYGLWCQTPLCWNTVGPLPFGNVQDLCYDNWQESVKAIQPDIIYCLLNMQTIDLAHEVMTAKLGIPFVWHFKEGPFFCMKTKLWNKLVDLYNFCDGRIFTNEETKEWFDQFLINKDKPTFLLDGDLPKANWFTEKRSKRLSEKDGEIHTLIAGRPMGLVIDNVAVLTEQKIHLHFYGDIYFFAMKHHFDKFKLSENPYIHVHSTCTQANWVEEFSQYDAGWLHIFKSKNHGELLRAEWHDLNYPARIPTLISAGLPMIQSNNEGHIVATEALSRKLDVGIYFNDMHELGSILNDKQRMSALSENAWNNRKYFQFDNHVNNLISFFYNVVDYAEKVVRQDVLV